MYSPCIMSVQYTWGSSVHWGISLSTVGVFSVLGVSLSTAEGAQYTGGYHEYTGVIP